MTIYIVRHGQTEENIRKILQGHMPGTLTAEGREQVSAAAESLAMEGILFSRIVSSDLKRAMDSADIISARLGLPVTPMKALRERDWGGNIPACPCLKPRKNSGKTGNGYSREIVQKPKKASICALYRPSKRLNDSTTERISYLSPTDSSPAIY